MHEQRIVMQQEGPTCVPATVSKSHSSIRSTLHVMQNCCWAVALSHHALLWEMTALSCGCGTSAHHSHSNAPVWR
jgi:hypothetical protein